MSIQSTREISRETAIVRIRTVYGFIHNCYYYDLVSESSEYDYDIDTYDFTEIKELDVNNIHNWTDKQLETQMDKPFLRFSIFENYQIQD